MNYGLPQTVTVRVGDMPSGMTTATSGAKAP